MKLFSLRTIVAAAAIAGAFVSSSASASLITFSDSAFNSGDYNVTTIYKSDASVGFLYGFTSSLDTLSGRSGTAPWTAAAGFVNNSFGYNPSTQGSILSIDASVDKFLLVSIGDLNGYTGPFGNSFRPLIEQGGNYYLATIAGTGLPGDPAGDAYSDSISTNIAQSGLLATSFVQYDFSTGAFGIANPNFAGGLMHFGIGQISTTGGLAFTNAAIGASYDNLRLALNTVTVPEPGTLALLALGLVGVAVGRRPRQA